MKRFEYIKEMLKIIAIYRQCEATKFEVIRFYCKKLFTSEENLKKQIEQANNFVIVNGARYTKPKSFIKNISRKGWLRLLLALPILPLFIFASCMAWIFTWVIEAINDYYFNWLKNTFGD